MSSLWTQVRTLTAIVATIFIPSARFALAQNQNSALSTTVTSEAGPIRAGGTITIHVELDSVPTVPRPYLNVGVRGASESNGFGAAGNSVQISPGQKIYNVKIDIPADAPGGTWTVYRVMVGSGDGLYSKNLKFDEHLTFEVIQETTFSLPNEAKVTINPSQEELLRRAAIEVQNKLEALKESIAVLSASKHGSQVTETSSLVSVETARKYGESTGGYAGRWSDYG